MSHEHYSLDELAKQLGRDRREIEKLVSRGRIPGRKVGGDWQFHPTEITQWLEQEMREYTDRELKQLEELQVTTETDSEFPITGLLAAEFVEVHLQARTRRSVLEGLIEVAGRTWQVWEPATVLKAVLEREETFSTAFDNGVAIPHPRNPQTEVLGQSIVAFGKTGAGVPFGDAKGGLSDLFFLVLARDPKTHLKILARLGRLIRVEGFLDDLRGCEINAEAHDLICSTDEELSKQ